MAVGGGGVVFGVCGIFGAEGLAGSPALTGEDLVAEARGVVCPGSVLRVVGNADTAGGLLVAAVEGKVIGGKNWGR